MESAQLRTYTAGGHNEVWCSTLHTIASQRLERLWHCADGFEKAALFDIEIAQDVVEFACFSFPPRGTPGAKFHHWPRAGFTCSALDIKTRAQLCEPLHGARRV